ncbi:DMT family transporter [Bacilliculturomica massiliensis]|uniref:DMT family transporter n=1 Tax=Bacilliculturomica massiliensis TaxID=1917867 RepID=UPI002ED06C78
MTDHISSQHPAARGHLAAFVTIFIWGTTFISTKVLLTDFEPLEILFFRFLIGYGALWIAAPRLLRMQDKKQELWFMAAGLCGVTLYYLLENFALTFTLAANVGVIISIAPFFTALCDWLFLKGRRPDLRFLTGFVLAMAGVCLISFRSGGAVELNPAGDVLAVTAAVI